METIFKWGLYFLPFMFIYLCIDEKKGARLGAIFLSSAWIYLRFKIYFFELTQMLPEILADVLGGWILGAVILGVYFPLCAKIDAFFAKAGLRAGMIFCAAVSFIMIVNNGDKEMLLLGGIMLGAGAGCCLNARYVGFNAAIADKTGAAKFLFVLVRFLLGVTGFLLILAAAGKIIPQESANKNLYEFLRFALGGLWLCAGSPWVFVRLHLAAAGKDQ